MELTIPQTSHLNRKYDELSAQISALITGEQNFYANLANVAAALKQTFDFFWVGFYIVENSNELVLGPFQGPIACTRIKKGQGVCGSCWEKGETIVVDNVADFPGHIACNAKSKSEIVTPLYHNKKIIAILDVDADQSSYFNAMDAVGLEKICKIITGTL